MCLLGIAWRLHARFALALIANRDEFHARAAAPLAPWPQPAGMIAGRDLQAGGTWLGVDQTLRLGVVTNFRELQPPLEAAPSRGTLIPQFLGQSRSAREFLEQLQPQAVQYSGFNLLLADAQELWYASNRTAPFARRLPPGLYGLSNHYLDSPWPKVERTRVRLQAWLAATHSDAEPPQRATKDRAAGAHERAFEALFEMLADRAPAPLPSTPSGLPAELEAAISAPFVVHPAYGTRCSSVVLIDGQGPGAGTMHVAERRFAPDGLLTGATRFALARAR